MPVDFVKPYRDLVFKTNNKWAMKKRYQFCNLSNRELRKYGGGRAIIEVHGEHTQIYEKLQYHNMVSNM